MKRKQLELGGRWGEVEIEKGPADLFPAEPTDDALVRKMGLEPMILGAWHFTFFWRYVFSLVKSWQLVACYRMSFSLNNFDAKKRGAMNIHFPSW